MQTARLVERLKQEMKMRRVTYMELAYRIGLSEVTVKRMFAQKNFTLERLDQILLAIGCDLEDIARPNEEDLLSRLNTEQEAAIVKNPQTLLVAVCAMNLLTFEQILASYRLGRAEVIKALTDLEKIGFLKLLPNDRIKLLTARTFEWLPNGPIQSYFRSVAATDFLNAPFDGEGEILRLINMMLTEESLIVLNTRLKQVAREVLQIHQGEAKLPLERRKPISVLMAVRPWLPKIFDQFRAG